MYMNIYTKQTCINYSKKSTERVMYRNLDSKRKQLGENIMKDAYFNTELDLYDSQR